MQARGVVRRSVVVSRRRGRARGPAVALGEARAFGRAVLGRTFGALGPHLLQAHEIRIGGADGHGGRTKYRKYSLDPLLVTAGCAAGGDREAAAPGAVEVWAVSDAGHTAVNVSSITLGGANINAFVGLGPYFIDGDGEFNDPEDMAVRSPSGTFDPAEGLTAAATGRAPADALTFEQHDFIATLGELERS